MTGAPVNRALRAAVAAAAAALAAACRAQDAAEEVDAVAATVGQEQILRSEVVAEMRRSGADDSRFGEVLDSLVERALALKAAKDAGVTLQEWVVDNRVKEIIDESFGGDRNILTAVLARQKTTFADWRKRIKEGMLVSAMRWQSVEKNVTASPSELRAEYNAHPERYLDGGRTSVGVILLTPDGRSRRAEVDATVATEGFAEAARRFSADGKASDGGVWRDIVPEEVFRPEICEAIARLAPGATSEWIDIEGWSFLLKADEKRRARTFREAYADVEANVKARKREALYRRWMDALRSETFVKIH